MNCTANLSSCGRWPATTSAGIITKRSDNAVSCRCVFKPMPAVASCSQCFYYHVMLVIIYTVDRNDAGSMIFWCRIISSCSHWSLWLPGVVWCISWLLHGVCGLALYVPTCFVSYYGIICPWLAKVNPLVSTQARHICWSWLLQNTQWQVLQAWSVFHPGCLQSSSPCLSTPTRPSVDACYLCAAGVNK